MELNLKGKNAFVSGGSKGIGKAIALELAKKGCNVAICARNQNEVDEEIAKLGVKGLGIIGDVTVKEDLDNIIKKTLEFFGNVDILINNVGGGGSWGTEEYEKFDEWDVVFEKNVNVARKFTISFLPKMKENKWGRVITISSIFGKESGGKPWFVISKAAEIALMKSLAGKYEGVTFNSVAPGYIDVGKSFGKREIPKSRIGNPGDVANLIVYLCSDKAKFINGACITVDGGESRGF